MMVVFYHQPDPCLDATLSATSFWTITASSEMNGSASLRAPRYEADSADYAFRS
jgi:hypothetical protein